MTSKEHLREVAHHQKRMHFHWPKKVPARLGCCRGGGELQLDEIAPHPFPNLSRQSSTNSEATKSELMDNRWWNETLMINHRLLYGKSTFKTLVKYQYECMYGSYNTAPFLKLSSKMGPQTTLDPNPLCVSFTGLAVIPQPHQPTRRPIIWLINGHQSVNYCYQ